MRKSPFASICFKVLPPVLLLAGIYGCSRGGQEAASEGARSAPTPEAAGTEDRTPGEQSGESALGMIPEPGDPRLDDLNYLRTLPPGGQTSLALGNYWMRRSLPESAVVYYEAAVQVAPRDANCLNDLGLAYKQSGRLDDAKEVFIRAVEADPENVHSFINLGNVYFANGDLEKAKAQYQLAVAVDSTNVNGFYNYAVVLDKMGDTRASIRALYRAIAQYPEDPQLRERLGDYFMKVKAYKRAVEQWTEAVGLDPTRDHLRDRIAQVTNYMRETGIIKD